MERIKLAPDSSTLSVELINSRITLLKSMLLANHRQVKSISRRLIALTKKSPLSSNSRKTHELSSILRQNTGSKNSSSTSILIYPLSVVSQIQPIGRKSVRILLDPPVILSQISIICTLGCILGLLSSIRGKGNGRRWKRRRRSSGARRTGDLARKHTPKTKTAHVDAHKGSEIRVIRAIKDHRAARNRKVARRRRRRRHSSGDFFFDETEKRSKPDRFGGWR
jgi:hypothetical protein